MERLARHLAASEFVAPVPSCSLAESEDSNSNHETPSTTATETPSASETHAVESPAKKFSAPIAVVKENLSGVWSGDKGETYTVSWKGGQWHCVREDNYTKKFSLWQGQDDEANVLWWGIQRTYYANLSDLTENSDQLRWYGARDHPGRRPRFAWNKISGASEQDDKSWQVEDSGKSAPRKQQAWPQKQKQPRPQQQQQQQPSSTQGRTKWVAVATSGGA